MTVATQMRISEAHRAVIDKAASASGKSRTEFMVSASLKAAEQVLYDQRIFVLDGDAFDKFMDYLDAPARPNEKLRDFLRQKQPWDE
jgi:uncharacterized protein (DUF1778 family)